MLKEWFLNRFGNKEEEVVEEVEEILPPPIPDFALEFCFPVDLDERKFTQENIKNIAKNLYGNLTLIADRHRGCDRRYWCNKSGYGFKFLELDIYHDIYKILPFTFSYSGSVVAVLNHNSSTPDYYFKTDYPELRNRVLYMCEYLMEVGEKIRKEKAQKLLTIAKSYDCREVN